MADLPVTPLADYGSLLASLPAANSIIQTQQAQQAATYANLPNIRAQTPILAAELQAKQIENQKAQLQMGLLSNAMNAWAQPAQNDSQVVPQSAAPGAAATSTASDKSDDDALTLDDAGLAPDQLASKIQDQYAVRDIWTPQEMRQLQMAGYMKLAGLPDLTDVVKTQHDARIGLERTQKTLAASADYDKAAYVLQAAPDDKFTVMERIHPELAEKLKKLADKNGWTPDQLNQITNTIAEETANQVHRWSGRPIDTKNADGIPRDEQTQLPLAGALPAGVSPADYQKAVQEAITPKEFELGGAKVNMAPWEFWNKTQPAALRVASPAAYVAMQLRGQGAQPSGQTTQPSVPAPAGASSAPGQPAPVPQAAGTAASPGAAPTSAKGPPTLPGVDIDAIPKLPQPPAPKLGVGRQPEDTTQANANVEIQKKARQTYGDASAQAQKNDATYIQLSKELDHANPDFYGPRGKYEKAYADFKTLLTGKSPNDRITETELDKYLTQMGVLGAKNLLGAGQQLRQQELLLLITQANPNTAQPLQAIKNLVAFGRANNEYDLRAANTGLQAINKGAEPNAVEAALSAPGVTRADYVQARVKQLTGVDLDKAAEQKHMPTGARLQAYADAHKLTVEEAKAALAKKGYQ